jgi:hypothetical protein
VSEEASTLDRLRALEAVEELAADLDFRAGDQIQKISAGTVRPEHVRSALRDPDALQSYVYEDITAFCAIKLISAQNPFVLIIFGREEGAARIAYAAFRLYEPESEVEKDPSAALAAFIDRYGLQMTTEAGGGRFTAAIRHKPDAQGQVKVGPEFETKGVEKWTMSGFTKADTERKEAVTMFAFGVDIGRYAADVERLSGG